MITWTKICLNGQDQQLQKLVDKGFLKGDEEGKLGLTEDLIRMFIVNDRAGVYGE